MSKSENAAAELEEEPRFRVTCTSIGGRWMRDELITARELVEASEDEGLDVERLIKIGALTPEADVQVVMIGDEEPADVVELRARLEAAAREKEGLQAHVGSLTESLEGPLRRARGRTQEKAGDPQGPRGGTR